MPLEIPPMPGRDSFEKFHPNEERSDGIGRELCARFAILAAVSRWSVKQQLPVAHTPNVDMNKVGTAIVPHSSALEAQGCVT